MKQLMLEICIRGGITCGYMRTLVSKIMELLISRGLSIAKAIQQLPVEVKQLEECHNDKSSGEDDSDEIMTVFRALAKHSPKKLKDIARLVVNMISVYNGSIKGGIT